MLCAGGWNYKWMLGRKVVHGAVVKLNAEFSPDGR